jgi:hypothetical protein
LAPDAERELHGLGLCEGHEGEQSIRLRLSLSDDSQAGNASGLRRSVGRSVCVGGERASGRWGAFVQEERECAFYKGVKMTRIALSCSTEGAEISSWVVLTCLVANCLVLLSPLLLVLASHACLALMALST